MRYWDTSALVPLIIDQPTSQRMREVAAADEVVLTWWGTRLECWGALCRVERAGALSGEVFRHATTQLQGAAARWTEVAPSVDLRKHAERLLRIHPLRAADALQLAACHIASEAVAERLTFITLDRKLGEIAEREGFEVVS